MKAADVTNKFVTIRDVALPADDGVLTVKAAVKSDVAGNVVTTPTEVSDEVTVDLTASTTIAINDSTDGEGYVNKAEFDGKTTKISGTVSDVEAGQTVTVTLTGKGGTTKTVEAKVGSDGKWETTATDFNGLSEGEITATAKVTDKAGNSAESTSDSTIKDTVIPVSTIKLTTDTAGASETDNISSKGKLTIVVDSTADQTTKSTIESVKYVKEGETESVELTGGNPTDGTGYVLPTDTKYKSITVTSVDEAGNKNTATLENVGIDSHKPIISSVILNEDSRASGYVTVVDAADTYGYFEGTPAGTALVTVSAIDDIDTSITTEYNSGIYTYEWDDSVGTDEQRSWYKIDKTTGVVTFTEAGANSEMNDFENGINKVKLQVKVTDIAGNTTTQEVSFQVENTIGISTVKDPISTTVALNEWGLGSNTLNIWGNVPFDKLTSDNAEKMYVGQHEDGTDYTNIPGYGNIFNWGDGKGFGDNATQGPRMLMGGGNDFVSAYNIYIQGKVFMGKGDDTFLFNSTNSTDGTQFNAPLVMMEQGDDYFSSSGEVSASVVLAGSGSDVIKINGKVDDYSMIDLGSKTVLDFEDNTAKGYKEYLKENYGTDTNGDASTDINTLEVAGNVDHSRINGGAGQDNVIIKGYINGDGVGLDSSVYLGDGNDTLTTAGIHNNSLVYMGSGNDIVTILNSNDIMFGKGAGSSTLNLEAGDDIFIYGGTTLDGKVNGGAGTDTIVLNTSANVKTDTNTTNLTSSDFTGIEVIKMEGVNGNAVDIQYSDLLADVNNNGALRIQGDSNDVVDLGWTNYNDDTVAEANLSDSSGGNWSKSDTKTVEGITYDVYHNSLAGADTSNDVYIQQGILVI